MTKAATSWDESRFCTASVGRMNDIGGALLSFVLFSLVSAGLILTKPYSKQFAVAANPKLIQVSSITVIRVGFSSQQGVLLAMEGRKIKLAMLALVFVAKRGRVTYHQKSLNEKAMLKAERRGKQKGQQI